MILILASWTLFFKSSLISCMVFGYCVLVENFINHVRALSLNVVANCALLVSSFCTCLMFHIASHRKKCWSGSSTPVPWKTGNLISSPILFLCKGGFCYVLEELGYCGCARGELVCCVCALTGCAWPPPGICSVRKQPPRLLPVEVFNSGGEVVCVLFSNNSVGVFLSHSLVLLGVSTLCLSRYCSVSSMFPLNLFPALVRLGSSCIPSMTYRSDLNCKISLSHNSILIHKFKELTSISLEKLTFFFGICFQCINNELCDEPW